MRALTRARNLGVCARATATAILTSWRAGASSGGAFWRCGRRTSGGVTGGCGCIREALVRQAGEPTTGALCRRRAVSISTSGAKRGRPILSLTSWADGATKTRCGGYRRGVFRTDVTNRGSGCGQGLGGRCAGYTARLCGDGGEGATHGGVGCGRVVRRGRQRGRGVGRVFCVRRRSGRCEGLLSTVGEVQVRRVKFGKLEQVAQPPV